MVQIKIFTESMENNIETNKFLDTLSNCGIKVIDIKFSTDTDGVYTMVLYEDE